MKKLLALLIIITLCLSLTSCKKEKITRQSYAFDTVLTITADEKYQDEITEAFRMCQVYEKMFSRTNSESELYKLNLGELASPSDELKEVIEFSLDISHLTDGAFDVTITPLVDLWNIKERTTPPTEDEIKKAQEKVGYEKIALNPFSLGDAKIDMGAVAKGYIADKLVEHFKSSGANDVIIDLGGNVALIGEHTVGIRDPENPDDVFAVLTVKDKSVVTSGAYQRYFEHDGKRYHHIINPKTGYPADSNIISVTVVSPSSIVADSLSTSIYIMGEDALSLCNEFKDTDAIVMRKDGSVITTDGFAKKYNLQYNRK